MIYTPMGEECLMCEACGSPMDDDQAVLCGQCCEALVREAELIAENRKEASADVSTE